MMKRRTWFGIVLAAVLALSVLLTGCGGDEEEKKALKFKTEMPEVIDFNVAFDVEEYLEYDANESVEMEASYTENGTTKTYLAAGLLFTPTTLNDVTVKVWYEGDEAGAISKTLKIRIPAPSMASVPELEIAQGEKLVFAELLDKEKYPNFNYTSLTEVTIEITKVILPNGTEETIAAGTKEYTFEDGGQYTLYFELSNEGGSYTGTANVKVPLILTENEKDDLTNNIRQGSGSVATFTRIEEERTDAHSDWYYEIAADPDTDWLDLSWNPGTYWNNYIEIDIPASNFEQKAGSYYLTMDIKSLQSASGGVAIALVSKTVSPSLTGWVYYKDGDYEWNTISTYKDVRFSGMVEGATYDAIRLYIEPLKGTGCVNEPDFDPENVKILVDNLKLHQYTEKDFGSDLTDAATIVGSTTGVTSARPDNGAGGTCVEVVADPATNYNTNYWANYCDINLAAPIDLTAGTLSFDLYLGENNFTDYQIMLIDETIVAEKTLSADAVGKWFSLEDVVSSLIVNGDLDNIQRVRIVFGAGTGVKDGEVFPTTVTEKIYIRVDNMVYTDN